MNEGPMTEGPMTEGPMTDDPRTGHDRGEAGTGYGNERDGCALKIGEPYRNPYTKKLVIEEKIPEKQSSFSRAGIIFLKKN